jgi:chromosome segregation ATPase
MAGDYIHRSQVSGLYSKLAKARKRIAELEERNGETIAMCTQLKLELDEARAEFEELLGRQLRIAAALNRWTNGNGDAEEELRVIGAALGEPF